MDKPQSFLKKYARLVSNWISRKRQQIMKLLEMLKKLPDCEDVTGGAIGE